MKTYYYPYYKNSKSKLISDMPEKERKAYAKVMWDLPLINQGGEVSKIEVEDNEMKIFTISKIVTVDIDQQ